MNRLRQFLARPPNTLSSLDAYALWAAAYPPHAHNELMQIEQVAMIALMPPLHDRVVLDLACGTGRYGLLAAERGARLVLGIDNSGAMLAASPLAHRILAGGEGLPLKPNSIDVVLCGLALGHVADLGAALDEIGRVLRVGGVALISDIHPFIALNGGQRTFRAPDGRNYAVEHFVHLYSDYLRAAAGAGLRVESVTEPTRDTNDVPVAIIYFLRK